MPVWSRTSTGTITLPTAAKRGPRVQNRDTRPNVTPQVKRRRPPVVRVDVKGRKIKKRSMTARRRTSSKRAA